MISIVYYIVIFLSIILFFVLLIAAFKTIFETRKKSYNQFMINRLQRQIEKLVRQINALHSNADKQKLIDEIEKLKIEKQTHEEN